MLSLVEILRDIDAGRTTADAAIAASAEAIAERDPELAAFVRVNPKARAGVSGPLRGIAVGIKDIIDTDDLETENGSSIYAGWRPKADAAIVAELKRLGATGIGKTATTAFASMDPAATRNPHNPAHTPGGSSSGSAAAVGAGLVPLALGTQTGGSIIRPASFCGVAAIKPSFGLLPLVGVKAFAWSLDTLGLFAAHVADLAYALAALTGEKAFTNNDDGVPRIGLVTQAFAGDPEASGTEALTAARRAAERAGATVCDVALPESVARAWQLHPTLQAYEAARALSWEYALHRDALPPRVKGELEMGRGLERAAYDEARATALRARQELIAAFEDVDVLLTLSAAGTAPASLATTGDARFNRVWTQMGVPCVNVPGLWTQGLPVGVQVIAPYGEDIRALRAAAFLEHALG